MKNFIKITSPLGLIYLVSNKDLLFAVVFAKDWTQFKKKHPEVIENKNKLLKRAENQLRDYFARKRKIFNLPLDLEGTPFQQRAWRQLLQIPYGKTISYKEQAKAIGSAKAMRAIGGANGANNIPIIIPCHRVIASDGSLGGYSGGLKIKKFLLGIEKNINFQRMSLDKQI